ncbi:MAG: hypothetical protein PVI23_15365 [Maricaulaceae bacterium]|jgi:hypothetical protein
MFMRLAFVAAAASAATMCATPQQTEEPQGEPGPDGLILYRAPATGVEAGDLPSPTAPAAAEADESEAD